MSNTMDKNIVLATKRNPTALREVQLWLARIHPAFTPVFGGNVLSHYFKVSAKIHVENFDHEEFIYALHHLWSELEYLQTIIPKSLLLPVSLDNNLSLDVKFIRNAKILHTGAFIFMRSGESYWLDNSDSPIPLGLITGPWDEIILEIIVE